MCLMSYPMTHIVRHRPFCHGCRISITVPSLNVIGVSVAIAEKRTAAQVLLPELCDTTPLEMYVCASVDIATISRSPSSFSTDLTRSHHSLPCPGLRRSFAMRDSRSALPFSPSPMLLANRLTEHPDT